MNFKKQPFGFMDMLRFKKMVPTRRKMLAQGDNKPLPQEYRRSTAPTRWQKSCTPAICRWSWWPRGPLPTPSGS